MVAAISPADINYEETLSTLRYEAVIVTDVYLITESQDKVTVLEMRLEMLKITFYCICLSFIKLHSMQPIATDLSGVCPSVSLSRMHWKTPHSSVD